MMTLKNVTLLLAPLLLAACGGGSETTDSDSATPVTPNMAPVITTGGDFVTSASRTVTLSGNISDSDGSIVSHRWEQVSGTPVTLSTPNATVTSFVAPTSYQEQTLVFRLVATDNEGATSSQTVTVKVTAASNQSPQIAAIADQTVRPNTVTSLIANATDPDGQIAEYVWRQKSGTRVTFTNSSSQQVTFTVPAITEDELLSFEVTVKDDQGATATQPAFVHIKPNRSPAIHPISDVTVDINQLVSIAASAYDRDGTITAYQWEQTAGTNVTIADPNSQALSFTSPSLNREEILTFKVTATDNEGATGSRTVDVTVQNTSNLIDNLTFETNSIKLCFDRLKERNHWKFVDEVTHFTCQYGYHREIEQLTSLTKLDIRNTTSLPPVDINFSAFPNLTELTLLQSSGISNIDVSQNTSLEKLTVSDATFSSVNLANNTNITDVFLHRVPDLTNLDLVHNTKLTSLTVFGSQIQDLNLSHNVLLQTVRVFGVDGHPSLDGKLQSISLPSTDKLTQLKLSANKLREVNTANLPSLKDLDLSQNELHLISLANNVKLTHLRIKDNALASLDLANNTALTVLDISGTGAFEIETNHLTELNALYAANKSLSSFSSSHHSKLTALNLSENPINAINLTNMPLLRTVILNRTQIHSLDASNASNLVNLEIKTSALSSLTLPTESNTLTRLSVSFNSLSQLPVEQYTNLVNLEAAGNNFIDINIGSLTKLQTLHLGENALTTLDISNNNLLRCVSVYDAPLTDRAKDTLNQYALAFPWLDEITYTKATTERQCGYDPYTPTP
ncbi:hypothetical protein HC752_20080 [Vibrio sp. S9_S30]|uniref:leucine-rich repeat domain-containing protein n=1 Tax=Vibrio sp. S9_S30 TaxID=2720226 RepID=UPI001680FDA9|nr:Ig-like domain-containing protein [Vibrio sp. S9_S30]MBD1559244.1 hypothetical protein [Vibrio sp. S9_S30]